MAGLLRERVLWAPDDSRGGAADLGTAPTVRGFIGGDRVFGRYRLERILGRGGMGVVWLALDEELERNVALKFLPELVFLDAEAIADLKRETRRNLEITHPNIVRIYDFEYDRQAAAISMEFVDGSTLAALKVARKGCLGAGELRPIVAQLCGALDYAHLRAKVVHRDLKPANLMLTHGGELKITDFGIACSISDSASRVSKERGTSGTALFMSPQQAMGQKPSVTDDVYALGATLFDLLSGKPPFHRGDILAQLRESEPPRMADVRDELDLKGEPIPEAWEAAVRECLAKDPALRPRTAGEVWSRLEAAAAHDSTSSAQHPIPNSQETTDPPSISRGPGEVAAAVTGGSAARPRRAGRRIARTFAVLALLAAGAVGWWYFSETARTEARRFRQQWEAMGLQRDAETHAANARAAEAEKERIARERAAPIQRITFDALAVGPVPEGCFRSAGMRLVPIRGQLHIIQAVTPPMVMPGGTTKILMIDGGPTAEFAFEFDAPIKRFTITSVGLTGGSSVPTWRLTGYDRQGNGVTVVGAEHHLPQVPELASLERHDMVRIVLSVDNRFGNTVWATFNYLPIAQIEVEK